ncbi:MAG: murein biosynthesis integral membrane protein MurJ [Candidatus Methylomirabilales bacterium]
MATPSSKENPESPSSAARSAFMVGTGILLSRLAGLIRDRVFAHYFGNSDAADAFRAAFRIPNFLQNLFGEGVLSASFIPAYAGLLARRNTKEAGEVAGAIAAFLGLVVSILVLFGLWATPYLIAAIAPGFAGEKRELCIHLVRILFPGAGLLVFSAWCLGILNSHRYFLVSYTAPVIWNAAIIAALLSFGTRQPQFSLATVTAWGSVLGSLLQLVVQIPLVLRLVERLRLALDFQSTEVRTVIRNFVPVFFSRGVVQISAYVDSLISSLLPTGAVAGLSYAQTLYTLPVSLFGMSVSAAELPAMSGALGNQEEVAGYLRTRLNSGLRRIAFFIVPSAMAFLALGDVVTATIYQSGRFSRADTFYVWGILAGSAVGLLASTMGRLYASTYYALRDARTPLRFAILRVLLTTLLGYIAAIFLPPLLGIDSRWGVAGLTASAGVAGWLEFLLLRKHLSRHIGHTGLPVSFALQLWSAAAIGAGAAWIIKWAVGPLHPIAVAVLVLGPYGLVYLAMVLAFGVPEAHDALGRARRMMGSELR